ncbi:MAG TPA: antibiotic biosynthesis monooxygenase [Nocardioidaceae bacterium]|nr:antibiotic biosynthesis monooxygenase [Nocardioidaceae bacterium]
MVTSQRPVGLVVVSRFRVTEQDAAQFRGDLVAALDVLSRRPGHVDGRVGRNVDEPELWVLTTTWENVGSYRRALSAYDVKVTAVPLLSRAVDEPSAYETLETGVATNTAVPRSLD